MASKKKDGRAAWEVDFISVELSKEQKDQLRKWDVKYELTIDAISRLVSDGYKFSAWGDKAHDCVGVTLTSPQLEGHAHKLCISARGPQFLDALRAIAYKHLIVLDGSWSTLANNADPDSSWG